MRRYGMMLAIILIVAVNVVVLAGVVYNRSGEPLATITLTEREIPLTSYRSYSDRENTGLSLWLDWSNGFSYPGKVYYANALHGNHKTEWFNKEKLQSIGYDCSLSVKDPNAEIHYRKMRSRKTFAVLEYDGPAWNAWLADMQLRLGEDEKEAFQQQSQTLSRLFIIDVGNDSTALRQRYNEKHRYLIIPVTVRLNFFSNRRDSPDERKAVPYMEGQIVELLADTIYVPKLYRAILEKLLNDDQRKPDDYAQYETRKRGPAYEVTLHVGKRHEPWIAAIREMAPR